MPSASGYHYFVNEGGSPDRPPLILLHGEGGSYLSWPPELRHLQGQRVFTLDLPGHGKTEEPGRQSVQEYARSVIEFMNALGLGHAALVGHGLGGAVALALACEYPKRAVGIGLLSTGARLPIPAEILSNAAGPATLPLAVKTLAEMVFGPQAPAGLRETIYQRWLATRQTLFFSDLLACDRFDLSGCLLDVQAPALVVCGREDKLTPLHFSEDLARLIPGAALQTIDGAGHMLPLEQPRRLAQLITVFLATLPFQPGM